MIRDVLRERPWDKIGDFSNGGFLAHHGPEEGDRRV
jgi:hypothetical protein